MSKISVYQLIEALSLEDESVVNDVSELTAEKRTKKFTMQKLITLISTSLSIGKKIIEADYATTANLPDLEGNLTVDGGTSLSDGTVVLVKNQTDGTQNGVYVVDTAAWVLYELLDTSEKLDGALVYVRSGTVNAGRTYWQSEALPVIGVDDVVFDLIGGTSTGGGAGNRITDSGTIATITNNANYWDSYGNPSPAIGGIFNTTLPAGIAENDYYIEEISTGAGLPKHKIECKTNADGDLVLIKIPYLQ